MTIEDAIIHCTKVAEQQELKAKAISNQLVGSAIGEYANGCIECAIEHRQLSNWLLELKDLRSELNEQGVFIDELMKENNELKRLLKLAINALYSERNGRGCKNCKLPTSDNEREHRCENEIPNKDCGFIWAYDDEAKRLLKED